MDGRLKPSAEDEVVSLTESRLYRETLAAAIAFHARKLWLEYENDDCFAVVVPGEEHPMFATIMGQSGMEFGLMLFRGQNACQNLLELLDSDPDEQDLPDSAAFMGFSMSRYQDVPPIGRSFLAKAGLAGRRSDIVPFFIAKEAGREPRKVTPQEVSKLLYVLRGTLAAREAGKLEPTPLGPDAKTLTLVLSGDPLDPDLATEFRRYIASFEGSAPELVDVPGDLTQLPRLQTQWVVGLPPLPVGILGDDRTVRALLIVEEESELVVLAQPIQGSVREAVELVLDAFRGQNALQSRGIPREIGIANLELYRALSPALDQLGVDCWHEPVMLVLNRVFQSLLDHLAGHGRDAEDADRDPDALPPDDDLAEWKRIDKRLYDRALVQMAKTGRDSDRAIARYFGDLAVGKRLLEDRSNPFPFMTFFEWCFLDYRAVKRSKTLAEKMLAGDMPKAERMLIEARTQTRPSVYKVEAIKKGESLTLLDVLFGGTVVAHDRGLSDTAIVDMGLPARVFPAGDFHFVSPLGPPLAVIEVEEAIEFVERLGMQLTPEGGQAKTHYFGWLWKWVDKRREHGFNPQLVNTDGDGICFQTATYLVKDEAQARAAISAREDISCDQEDMSYIWFRPDEPERAGAVGERTHLGTLSFIGDELLLEVNSAERLQRARAWLDRIPGVRFHSARSRTLDEVRRTGIPPDDQLGNRDEVPMTPEIVAHLRELMCRHYMKWLGMPLPALDGKTPREACKTPEGRKKVLLLIRTMPKPMGRNGPDIDVPREEMMKDLGLDGE